jgi:hypothetical protein
VVLWGSQQVLYCCKHLLPGSHPLFLRLISCELTLLGPCGHVEVHGAAML